MNYINFDKSQLINLEYSLGKEILRSNRAGTYSYTTIIGCNTRKYHGLLISPMPHLDEDNHVLLSSLDETIIQKDAEFNLGIHKYEGDNYTPKGHKYVRDFDIDSIPKTLYRVGAVQLTKESLLVEKEEQVLVKYTLLDAQAPVTMKFRPFLAFRKVHFLSHSNLHVHTKFRKVENGIKMRLYDGYPYLNMQFSKAVEFVPVPDWYYNIEYLREQERGYEYKEDLYVPGYFETTLKKGESIIFSASLKEATTRGLKRKFTTETSKRIERNSFRKCLENAAEQFFIKSEKGTEILAGFPWFGSMRRDTFIALPGLTLPRQDEHTFRAVIDTMLKYNKNCFFQRSGKGDGAELRTADSMLWLIWALQQYENHNNADDTWKKYGKYIKRILSCYTSGKQSHIHLHDNGLLHIDGVTGPLTWMDSMVKAKEVVPRNGYVIEINALWYNALKFAQHLADRAGEKAVTKEWVKITQQIEASFVSLFWDENKNYLADFVAGDQKNMDVRPNQVIAISMHYSPLSVEQKKQVLDLARKELLTSRGLRTLSPKNPYYKGTYTGDVNARDTAYHQGTIWPWLLQHYAEAYLSVFRESGLNHVKSLVDDFEDEMTKNAIGTISEIYDGDPPNNGRGGVSFASSVAALLRILGMIEKFESKKVTK